MKHTQINQNKPVTSMDIEFLLLYLYASDHLSIFLDLNEEYKESRFKSYTAVSMYIGYTKDNLGEPVTYPFRKHITLTSYEVIKELIDKWINKDNIYIDIEGIKKLMIDNYMIECTSKNILHELL